MKYLKFVALGLLMLPATQQHAWAQDSGRNLTIVLDDAVTDLEPCNTTNAVNGLVTRENVLETLTEVDPNDGSVKPRLATGWEQQPDKSWVFHLRTGVKFSDGAPFDAASLKTSTERFFNPKLSDAMCLNRDRFFSDAKLAIKVVDENTVDFVSTPPDPILPRRLSQMLISSPNTPPDTPTNNPIGTGPYVVKSYTPDQSVVIQRAPSYWGALPQTEQATYVWRTESSVRADMGKTGEADIALAISPSDADNPKTDLAYFNSETTRLRFAIGQPPLSDIRVREAVQYAVDRASLAALLNPKAELATQTVLPSVLGYNKSLPQQEYNLDKAKQLIAAAKADGVPVDKPIRFINRDVLFSNTDEFAQAIQGMLSEIGLNLQYSNLNSPQWIQAMQRPTEDGTPAMFMDSIDNNMGDAIFSIWTRYFSTRAAGGGNVSDFGNAAFDKDYTAAISAGGDERKQLLEDAMKVVYDAHIDLPLFHMVGIVRVNPRIKFSPTMALVQELQLAQVTYNQ